jgi:hypothetical protein
MPDNGSVDIIHNGNIGCGFGIVASEIKRYQTFVAPPHCTGINGVWAKLRQVAGVSFGFPRAELYATLNNKPTGSPLASTSLNTVGATFDITWGSINASGLQPGKKYAIVLSGDTFPDPSNNTRYEWAVAPVYSTLNFGRWDGRNWIDESRLGNGWMQLDVKYGDNVVDVTHDGTSGFTFGQDHDQLKRYQTFFARETQAVVGVDVKVRKMAGSTHSDITVELFDTYQQEPVMAPLASAVIPSSAVGSNWTVVNAPLHFQQLSRGCEYAIVLS